MKKYLVSMPGEKHSSFLLKLQSFQDACLFLGSFDANNGVWYCYCDKQSFFFIKNAIAQSEMFLLFCFSILTENLICKRRNTELSRFSVVRTGEFSSSRQTSPFIRLAPFLSFCHAYDLSRSHPFPSFCIHTKLMPLTFENKNVLLTSWGRPIVSEFDRNLQKPFSGVETRTLKENARNSSFVYKDNLSTAVSREHAAC